MPEQDTQQATTYRPQALVIFTVFLIFLLNAVGIVELPIGLDQKLKLRPDLLADIFFSGAFPPPILGPDFVTFLVLGLVLSLCLPLLDPMKASALTFFSMFPPFYVEYAYPARVPIVPMEYTLLTILVLFSVNVLIKYFVETRAKQDLLAAFGQYVPPEVADAIGKTPNTYSMQGEARELTVLFSDIRHFSSMSETLTPRQLAELLNTYFTRMTDVLHRHGATIDKYMGDAIMAFWGAPLAQPDHAVRALNAGRAMIEELAPMNQVLTNQGLPAIDIGIGVNTGVMNVGNMGSRYRIAYTVVGDAVNLGARLEGLTRLYDAKLIVSETTKAANPEHAFRELDHVRVKGKGVPTRIYEPIGRIAKLSADEKQDLDDHHTALTAYYEGNWVDAETGFAALNAKYPDTRYYVVMRNRVMNLSAGQHPNFDGITSFNSEPTLGFS